MLSLLVMMIACRRLVRLLSLLVTCRFITCVTCVTTTTTTTTVAFGPTTLAQEAGRVPVDWVTHTINSMH